MRRSGSGSSPGCSGAPPPPRRCQRRGPGGTYIACADEVALPDSTEPLRRFSGKVTIASHSSLDEGDLSKKNGRRTARTSTSRIGRLSARTSRWRRRFSYERRNATGNRSTVWAWISERPRTTPGRKKPGLRRGLTCFSPYSTAPTQNPVSYECAISEESGEIKISTPHQWQAIS